jgi:hypothetical protein
LHFGNLTSFKGLAVTAMEAQQSFRLARIASQEGFHALLTMTIEPFQIARKAEHKKAQWIPACAGMTTYAGKEKKYFQTVSKIILTVNKPPFNPTHLKHQIPEAL